MCQSSVAASLYRNHNQLLLLMKKRIIVVEDDASIAEVLTLILQHENYRVESFVNDSFMETISDDMPGLVLLDLWLLDMNGKSICLQIKNNETLKHIPVVIISAHRDIQLYAEEAGANEYLEKPFDMKVLLSVVEKYM